MYFSNHENGENLAFLRSFSFFPILDYYRIRTRKNFENPNSKSLDPHQIMLFKLKELFLGSTDFTVAIFKILQISKKSFGYALQGTYSINYFHFE